MTAFSEGRVAFWCSLLLTSLHLTSSQLTQSSPPPPPPPAANFSGQQVIIFGTSLSDDGNGVAPYVKGTLNTSQVVPPTRVVQSRMAVLISPVPHYIIQITLPSTHAPVSLRHSAQPCMHPQHTYRWQVRHGMHYFSAVTP
jgi:hypothetical protein